MSPDPSLPLFEKKDNGATQFWDRLIQNQVGSREIYSFWRRWYEGFLNGDPLPWDLQEQIALIPDETWEAGPEAVAAEIEKIEAEFQANPPNRPDSVPELERSMLRQLVYGLLAVPDLTGDFALSAAETVERATQEYLNTSGENCLPPELEMLDQIPGHFRRLASILTGATAEAEAVAALELEIEALNAKVARLEGELKVARSKTLNGRFKAAAIENLAKTVTSPWMIGALGFGVCHFFGWTPSDWTLANLRGYADDVLRAEPKPEK